MKNIKKQFEKLKMTIDEDSNLKLTDEEVLRYQDILKLLEERGYIHNMNVDGINWYRKIVEWDGFGEWLNEQIKESQKVTRREWIIGIGGAIIGALIGLIPTVIQILSKLIK